jgi:hypothetical protein
MSDTPRTNMENNTSCWDCSSVYPMNMAKCPSCGAINANTDLICAIEQLGGWCSSMMPKGLDIGIDTAMKDGKIDAGKLARELAAALAELERLRTTLQTIREQQKEDYEDAERYLFLRSGLSDIIWVRSCDPNDDLECDLNGDDLDAAIDAARKEGK